MDRVVIKLNANIATGSDGTDTLSSIEHANGSNFGSDEIVGTSGINFLNGQGGNDTVEGGGGNDLLTGGEGVDFVRYASAASAVIVQLGTFAPAGQLGGEGSATGGAGTDRLFGFEGSKAPSMPTGSRGTPVTTSCAAAQATIGSTAAPVSIPRTMRSLPEP